MDFIEARAGSAPVLPPLHAPLPILRHSVPPQGWVLSIRLAAARVDSLGLCGTDTVKPVCLSGASAGSQACAVALLVLSSRGTSHD